MPLSWNEIRDRAIRFSYTWKDEKHENGEQQSFWNDFFEIYGKKRRAVATFEEPVKKLSGNWGRIDLFWPGTCIVEHKSAGEDLGKAHAQGMAYIRCLIDSGREKEAPRWLIVSDFKRIAIHDLEPEMDHDLPLFTRIPHSVEFELKDLYKNVRRFSFIAGYKYHKLDPEDPANFEATELMAKLHDSLFDGGYRDHELCRFLVRLLFCFFAEDTGIFPPDAFKLFLQERTAEDGSDLGSKLGHLFQVLNTPPDKRGKNLDEDLAQFDYINGELFAEPLSFADFTSSMRSALIECAEFKWEKISPAIFGSLFQTIFDHADDRKRRQLGAHYTTETNIMKVARSLFLDEFRMEFDSAKADKSVRRLGRLRDLHNKLISLRFLDPACGCGNFLVITYREIRQLELEILVELEHEYLEEQGELIDRQKLDVSSLSKINVDQMYGIEIEEFPARIAEVALWLTDHQANTLLSEAFGERFARIPLRKSPHIHCDNALRIDWKTVLPASQCSFVLGNPPFIGKHLMSIDQGNDINIVGAGIGGIGVLDFVCAWYLKASEYIKGTTIRVAFVSTNSITQGEQPGVLWPILFQRGIKIHFAHRTFQWESEARGKAHVHCVIIGFGSFNISNKVIFDYEYDPAIPSVESVPNISPYLISGNDRALPNRSTPICNVPAIVYGSKPVDDGNLIIEENDRVAFSEQNPFAVKYIKRLMCSDEYLYNIPRWCLWLKDCYPSDVSKSLGLLTRLANVKKFRENSTKEATRRLAAEPSLFAEDRQPSREYILVPLHTSEKRQYVPFGYFSPENIVHNSCSCIPDATIYHFGILTSKIHMAWMKVVCGRLESRYRYSNKIVYNNFPWPETITDAQRKAVSSAAQAIIDNRKTFSTSTLADLYDPLTMPRALVEAHAALDRAVDRCYRKDPFPNDRSRVEYLFNLYEKISFSLTASNEKKKYEPPKILRPPQNQLITDEPASEDLEDSDLEEDVISLASTWYEKALNMMQAGFSDDGTDLLADALEEMILNQRFESCNADLGIIAAKNEQYPMDALITLLTFSRTAKEHLPNRSKLIEIIRPRLMAIGKNAEKILRNL